MNLPKDEIERIIDFIQRTQINLSFIEEMAKREENENRLFEVGQLINSLVGLLIFPKEKHFDKIPKTYYENLLQDGWPKIEINWHRTDKNQKHLKTLIRMLRNSVAHFNIEFLPETGEGHIEGLRFKNICRCGDVTFEAIFTVEELRSFISKFCYTITNILNDIKHNKGDEE